MQKKSYELETLLSGWDVHSFIYIRTMFVGPGAGGAVVIRTDKVAALLEVTLSWELEITCVLLTPPAFICRKPVLYLL